MHYKRDTVWRRAQRERAIERTYNWMRERSYWYNNDNDPYTTARDLDHIRGMAVRRHGARQSCSGWCCGNPRRWFLAPTLAETRFAITCSEVFEEEGLAASPKTTKTKW